MEIPFSFLFPFLFSFPQACKYTVSHVSCLVHPHYSIICPLMVKEAHGYIWLIWLFLFNGISYGSSKFLQKTLSKCFLPFTLKWREAWYMFKTEIWIFETFNERQTVIFNLGIFGIHVHSTFVLRDIIRI